jgi:hypothetical protein
VTFNAAITTTPAGGSPTGSVAFKDGATIIAGCGTQPVASSAASCTTTALTVGGHNITAVYSGDGNFITSTTPTPATETVSKASTATTLSADVNPAVFGQTVTFSASVATVAPGGGVPTGTVTFSDNGGPVAGCATPQTLSLLGTATCVTSGLSAATHPITAVYNSDANFNASPTSNTVNELVNKAATTASLTSDVNTSVSGQTVTFIAAISVVSPGSGAPAGTVSFSDTLGTIPGCGAPQPLTAGIATCATNGLSVTTPGTPHSITAVYNGNANFNVSPASNAVTQVVTSAFAPPPGTAVVINGGPSNGKVFIVAGNGVSSSIYDPAASALTAGPALAVSRSFLTATAIGSGQVLLAGGNAKGGSTFELCSFGAKSSCSSVGASTAQRCNAAAALVGSSVLVAGGDDCSANALASWDLWSADGIVSSTAANQMSEPRASLTATVIDGGTVLLAGGGTSSADLFKDSSISKTAPMSAARSGHSATLLPAGSKACASGSCVLIAGGVNKVSSPSWEIFDVASGTFGRAFNASEMLNPLRAHQAAALLADGRVLLAGGMAQNQAIETSETFDGVGFKAGPSLQTARTGAAAAFVPALDLLMLSGGSEAPELITGY